MTYLVIYKKKQGLQLAEWPKKPLSFTNCTIITYMESEKIDFLVTFDTEFDGLANIVKI